jgi:hypothetical protein
MLQVGNSSLCFIVVAVVQACVYFGTIEEYYLGIIVLARVNGVQEGAILMMLTFITSGIIGPDFWANSPCDRECGAWLEMEGVSYLTWGQWFMIFTIVT